MHTDKAIAAVDNSGRVMLSEYMHWAKTRTRAKWYIGASGVANYPVPSLPLDLADLVVNGQSSYGYGPLQDAIARHSGVTVDRVFSALGTSQANFFAMAVTVRPGDEVLMERPAYELMVSAARYLGAKVTFFDRRPEEGFAVDPEAVRRALTPRTRLVVITNLHNPTSAIVEEATLVEIGRACRPIGAKVLVDEVYLEALWERTPSTAALLGEEFLVTNSLTKIYGLGGLRIGWVLAAPPLVTAMWRLKDIFESVPPHAGERLGAAVFPHLPAIREHSKAMVEENRRVLREMLLRREEIECFDPGFGLVVFPRLLRGSVDRLEEHLVEKYETQITPGRFFDLPDHFRVGLGGTPEMFREGIGRLCAGLDDLPRG